MTEMDVVMCIPALCWLFVGDLSSTSEWIQLCYGQCMWR